MIAEAASLACAGSDTTLILDTLEAIVESDEMKIRFPMLRDALRQNLETGEYADRFGRRKGFVSGFAPDTAAVSLFAWLRHRGDFRRSIESVVSSGGDTDTVAFVAGSLAGIEAAPAAMPTDWVSGLRDWPINAVTLQEIHAQDAMRYPQWPLSLLRNAWFFMVVLGHVARRAFPPY